MPRKTAFSTTRKSTKPFYTWMSRFLEFEIDGLINKPRARRPRILKEGEIKSSNKNSSISLLEIDLVILFGNRLLNHSIKFIVITKLINIITM